MTISSVEETWSHSSGTHSTPDGLSSTITFNKGFTVQHTAGQSVPSILNDSRIPQPRTSYPGTLVPVTSRNVNRFGPTISIVVVTYTGEVSESDIEEGPELTPPKYTWSDTTSNEEIDADWDGAAIVNAAGEPINGVMTDVDDQTLVIERNYLAFSPWVTHAYRRSVNSDAFASYPPGTARLIGFSATNERLEGLEYWRVVARIQFRFPYGDTPTPLAWWERQLNQGMHCIRDGAYKRCIDKDKRPSSRPLWLNADGTQALDADGNPDSTKANWLYFKKYGELPYSALGLIG